MENLFEGLCELKGKELTLCALTNNIAAVAGYDPLDYASELDFINNESISVGDSEEEYNVEFKILNKVNYDADGAELLNINLLVTDVYSI